MTLLSLLVALPFLAAGALWLLPRGSVPVRPVVQGTALAAFLISVALFLIFRQSPPAPGGFLFETRFSWIQPLGIEFLLGLDGINIGLVLMSTAVSLAASFSLPRDPGRLREFATLFLVMSGGITGAFAAMDMFLFYFFHELALIPTFLMIGIWGRGPDRNRATFRITIYLTIGALIALAGIAALYLQTGATTFDMARLAAEAGDAPIAPSAQTVIFPLLLFGFGILVSLWPFHTWAPMGYAAAPTATAMLHAGALKKFGLYGLIRLAVPLVPEGMRTWMEILCLLALGNILFCGWVAMRQRDLHLLIGNSSVAHMGLAFLGIASLSLVGITGTVMLMVAHGLLAALAFQLAGWIHERHSSTDMGSMSGLLARAPFLGTCLLLALLAACGVPGFANFAGEIQVLFGAWRTLPWFAVAGAWGALIISAVYCLRAIRRMLHGAPGKEAAEDIRGLSRRLSPILLIALLLLFGTLPWLLSGHIAASAGPLLEPATVQSESER